MKVTIGQTVFVVEKDYRGATKGEPKEFTVASVGRKYFTINNYHKIKFSLDTGLEHTELNYKDKAYESLNEILEEREYGQLRDNIRTVFNGFGKLNLSLEQLRKIYEILIS